MASKLTPKQEKFVQGLVSGLSQRKAYRASYSTQNMKDSTVDEKASRLFKQDKIRARYEALMDEHKAKALWTREEAINDLKWLKEQSKKSIMVDDEGYVRKSTADAYLGAIQELNKLENLYLTDEDGADDRIQVVIKGNVRERPNGDFIT